MPLPESPQPKFDPQEWDKRKGANLRLGLFVGLIVVLVFLGALWRYRPV